MDIKGRRRKNLSKIYANFIHISMQYGNINLLQYSGSLGTT